MDQDQRVDANGCHQPQAQEMLALLLAVPWDTDLHAVMHGRAPCCRKAPGRWCSWLVSQCQISWLLGRLVPAL